MAASVSSQVNDALDVCLCRGCRRPVTGGGGDFKVCVGQGDGNLVLCAACFWKDERRESWLRWQVDLVLAREPINPWLAAFPPRRVKAGR